MSNTSLLGSYGGLGESSLMFRNRIINGDMRIDQRNSGAAISYTAANSPYIVDRFTVGLFGTTYSGTVMEAQQVSDAPAGFSKSMKVTAKQNVVFDSNKLGAFVTHKIEGQNIIDLSFGLSDAKTLTISFWVKANKTGTVSVNLENAASDRSYGTTVTISQAGVWEYKTVSITADTSGTWLKDNGAGLVLNIGVGSNGSWLVAPAGSWSATRAIFNSAQTNFLSATNDYIAITGVQLEAGPTATPFERRPIGVEEQLCFRYFWKWKAGDTAITYASITGAGLNSAATTIYTPVSMRIIPTISHNFSNANFVTTGPTGVQWGVLISGVAFSNKTGTASFSPLATSTNAVTFRIISADFTSAINTLTVGPSVYIDVSAEL
jgi:hypothetical protein